MCAQQCHGRRWPLTRVASGAVRLGRSAYDAPRQSIRPWRPDSGPLQGGPVGRLAGAGRELGPKSFPKADMQAQCWGGQFAAPGTGPQCDQQSLQVRVGWGGAMGPVRGALGVARLGPSDGVASP